MTPPNPFRRVPKFRYLARWSLYMVPLLLVVGIVGVGIGARMAPFTPPLEKPLGVEMDVELPVWAESAWPPVMAKNHYARVMTFAVHFPTVCLPGREINDFQVQHCAPFRVRFGLAAALALLPLGVLLVGLMMGAGKIDAIYELGGALITGNAPAAQGTVTNPARVGGDFFSWLYGFQTIAVQLANGDQKVVYLPADMPIPLPGQKFRVYNMGRHLWAERWTGTLHAPHLAIVSGSR